MSIFLPKHTKKILMILFFFVGYLADQKVSSKDNKIEIERFEKLFYNSSILFNWQIKKNYPSFSRFISRFSLEK